MTALRGCGCKPLHAPARDALVTIGTPAVGPLVERLQANTQWWIQLECVYILGLMGPNAADAESALHTFVTQEHHPLPHHYAEIALAAVRGDIDQLAELAISSNSSFADYALELLRPIDQDGRALPALRAFSDGNDGPHAKRISDYVANAVKD